MKKWKKHLIGWTIFVILLLLVMSLVSYIMIKRTLPQYDGAVTNNKIDSDVIVYRDSMAVPMIIAKSQEDAAYVLGYLHAQDRLFQMDIARRAGEGKLSEIFGDKTAPFDLMFRTVGIARTASESYKRIDSITGKILIAYSNGVNKFIDEAKGRYPIEFGLLGYEPYKWKPEHSLIIARMMAWELNLSWWSDVAFAHIIQKIGKEKTAELLPGYPENAPLIIDDRFKRFAEVPLDLIKTDREFRKFIGFNGTHIGSNSWVVSGNRSSAGKPIIANDPHLAFSAPGKWYFALIRSKEWNAEGFTLPGLPSVVIGKNRNIAWAMTNVMADDADFYIEQIDTINNRYLVDGQWKNLEVVTDSIYIKNKGYHKFVIRQTHRGPIISGIHPYRLMNKKSENLQISMRWTGNDFTNEMLSSILINRANNWREFSAALKYFNVPGQNFIYADKEGNIGYVCAALLPVRKNASPTLIYDGRTTDNDWKGYVSYDLMPKLFNPENGFIASANNKTVRNFPYHISNIWEPSSRIERITQLLNSKKLHTPDDFRNYQTDFVSPYAKFVTENLLKAFENVKIKDANLALALELLENWDYKMSAGSQTPSIYSAFLFFLIKNTFEDELGPDLIKEYVILANVPYRKIYELLGEENNFLFDDVTTPRLENKNDILRKSLVDALSYLETNYGTDPVDWQWGKIHSVTFKHMFHGISSLADKLIDIGPFPIGGDGTTVFNTEYSFVTLFDDGQTEYMNHENPFEIILGPSMRYIYDFANPGYIKFIMPTGQSGNFISPHYRDMTEMWLNGKYRVVPLNENEFEEKSAHKLVMEAAKVN
ncbi:penicillin acylase family protein [Melioribacter sp. Ez-97]|uniref:penicillin acylase family protein n=1 Tax=Melioribacter sp. Ez-97 TaxID=3423434 RepID=UPI003EDAA5D1